MDAELRGMENTLPSLVHVSPACYSGLRCATRGRWGLTLTYVTCQGFGFTKENELFVGRLAQLGFAASLIGEGVTGKGILGQLSVEVRGVCLCLYKMILTKDLQASS